MYRRIVSLLLLPCVLLTQLVAVFGHSHGGNEPAGHGLRPHFHMNLASAGHHHSHHHHGPGGPHHHDDGDSPAEPDSQPAQQAGPLSESEHDSDAVFFACVSAVINARSAVDDAFGSLLSCAVAVAYLPANLCAAPTREVVNRTHWPPPRGYACPLYLWQLTLLI